jgi:hypothetical protein
MARPVRASRGRALMAQEFEVSLSMRTISFLSSEKECNTLNNMDNSGVR